MMNGFTPRGLARTGPLIAELARVAEAHGITITQAALAWTVTFHGKAVVAIPGATKPAQAAALAGAMNASLSEQEMSLLDAASREATLRSKA
jgi:aryl-alcohol dehydrogenase-like predicted oxidoreductase